LPGGLSGGLGLPAPSSPVPASPEVPSAPIPLGF
jgi:hypothetical protein